MKDAEDTRQAMAIMIQASMASLARLMGIIQRSIEKIDDPGDRAVNLAQERLIEHSRLQLLQEQIATEKARGDLMRIQVAVRTAIVERLGIRVPEDS